MVGQQPLTLLIQVRILVPELKAAETEIKRQTAIIDNEKAHHEQSRARADATRTAAEAEGRSIEASVVTANTRAAFIKERTEAIGDCYQRFTLNMPSGDMVLFSMSMTRPNALTTDGGSSRREAFARVRQECVPENDTPTAQIYPLGRH